jgi:hypothetical protein
MKTRTILEDPRYKHTNCKLYFPSEEGREVEAVLGMLDVRGGFPCAASYS